MATTGKNYRKRKSIRKTNRNRINRKRTTRKRTTRKRTTRKRTTRKQVSRKTYSRKKQKRYTKKRKYKRRRNKGGGMDKFKKGVGLAAAFAHTDAIGVPVKVGKLLGNKAKGLGKSVTERALNTAALGAKAAAKTVGTAKNVGSKGVNIVEGVLEFGSGTSEGLSVARDAAGPAKDQLRRGVKKLSNYLGKMGLNPPPVTLQPPQPAEPPQPPAETTVQGQDPST